MATESSREPAAPVPRAQENPTDGATPDPRLRERAESELLAWHSATISYLG